MCAPLFLLRRNTRPTGGGSSGGRRLRSCGSAVSTSRGRSLASCHQALNDLNQHSRVRGPPVLEEPPITNLNIVPGLSLRTSSCASLGSAVQMTSGTEPG